MTKKIETELTLEENLALMIKAENKRFIRNMIIGGAIGLATMIGGLVLIEKMDEKIEPAIED